MASPGEIGVARLEIGLSFREFGVAALGGWGMNGRWYRLNQSHGQVRLMVVGARGYSLFSVEGFE